MKGWKLIILSAALFVSYGCAARGKLSEGEARELIARAPGLSLKEDQIKVTQIVQPTSDHAVVEATISTGFKYQRVDGKWVLKEVRVGLNRWEDVGLVIEAINREKSDRARKMLELIAKGVERYRNDFSSYPQGDFEGLIDLISPRYLPKVIRLDPWSNPFVYQYSGSGYRLISVGADGTAGTQDDIVLVGPVR